MPRGGRFPVTVASFTDLATSPTSTGQLQRNGSDLEWYDGTQRVLLNRGILREHFISSLLNVFGDTRRLWLPKISDETTTTDSSKNAGTYTYDATIAARISNLGAGVAIDFNGSSNEADVPYSSVDHFGLTIADTPMSIVALVAVDDGTPASANTITAIWNKDTDGEFREYRLYLTVTTGYPTFELYDESANTYIGRQDQTALTDATWTLLVATYDGSASNPGINIYKNGSLVDDANSSSGTYVAMEDPGSAQTLLLAHTLSAAATPVPEEFFDGKLALVALLGKCLSTEEVWSIKSLCNTFYDLTL